MQIHVLNYQAIVTFARELVSVEFEIEWIYPQKSYMISFVLALSNTEKSCFKSYYIRFSKF